MSQATDENFSLGMPVEVAGIERELKKLWAEGEGAMTRASLINLALYSEEPGSLPRNTQIISQVTRNNACRAIVIGANPAAKEDRVESWISAHCHVSRAGSKHVCSEQLSFLLEGGAARSLSNIVFSHLDSDLPLHLWWQGEFPKTMDPQLWSWIDRLIYDSQVWKNFSVQMQRLETAQCEARERVVLCDLNWTRLDKVRLAVAQFFDHPASHHHFAEIEKVEIDFEKSYRSTAILLAGWLAAQLKWKVGPAAQPGAKLQFVTENGRKIEVVLREKEGQAISRVLLHSHGVTFVVTHLKDIDLLEVSRSSAGEKAVAQLLPSGGNDPVRLISDELSRGGPHHVYLRALKVVGGLI